MPTRIQGNSDQLIRQIRQAAAENGTSVTEVQARKLVEEAQRTGVSPSTLVADRFGFSLPPSAGDGIANFVEAQRTSQRPPDYVTTRAIGEEGGDRPTPAVSTRALGEEGGDRPTPAVSTRALGEEGGGPQITTMAVGEEGGGGGGGETTRGLGEEGQGGVTTMAVGEEGGGHVTTRALGEEVGGPPQITTMAVGEEGQSNGGGRSEIPGISRDLVDRLNVVLGDKTGDLKAIPDDASSESLRTRLSRNWTKIKDGAGISKGEAAWLMQLLQHPNCDVETRVMLRNKLADVQKDDGSFKLTRGAWNNDFQSLLNDFGVAERTTRALGEEGQAGPPRT